MKLHVLGFPHTETTSEWSACAYTQRTMDFAGLMAERGYDVRLYAGEQNEARVTEHVPVITRAQQRAWFPAYDRTKVFNDFDENSLPWQVFNNQAATAINARAEPGDVVCITMGTSHRGTAALTSGLLHVETGIGYSGVWSKYRVYESIAWRHYLAAKETSDNLRWFDEVIPRGYFMNQFPLGSGGVDYLFMGRLTARKGPHIAAEVCKRLGARLLVAGQGVAAFEQGKFIRTDEGLLLEGNVHYLGVLNPIERAVAMGSVRAIFMPTYYLEPGGGVAIEAQLCGTPVITTPWGAMTETVLQDETGYHCASLAEFILAAEQAQYLSRRDIRLSAKQRYSAPVIAAKYDKYFKKLSTVYGEGWYAV